MASTPQVEIEKKKGMYLMRGFNKRIIMEIPGEIDIYYPRVDGFRFTYELNGKKKVKIIGKDNFREVTAL